MLVGRAQHSSVCTVWAGLAAPLHVRHHQQGTKNARLAHPLRPPCGPLAGPSRWDFRLRC